MKITTETGQPEPCDPDLSLKNLWREADAKVQVWWDGDLHSATENDIRADIKNTLLFLPFPYSSAGGSERAFPEQYGWDTFFINLGMLAHGRVGLVRHHIENHLFMILRHDMVLNGNRTFYLTRSQTPLLAESVKRYSEAVPDRDFLCYAYPLLKKEYCGYWMAGHHSTPIGLATNRDLGDPTLRQELSSEAETGLDFCACFDGDIRQCVPLITNCALVKYARGLAWIAREIGWLDEAMEWEREIEAKAELVRHYCWDEESGFFFEYNYEKAAKIPVWSLCAYWTMWAGICTPEQATRLVGNMSRFETDHGLPFTSEVYPSPHPEYAWNQWGHPSGWPPMHIIVPEALDEYGFHEDAERIRGKFLKTMLLNYSKTGKLWEKYNVSDGGIEFPIERYDLPAFHGWSSGAIAVLGRKIWSGEGVVSAL